MNNSGWEPISTCPIKVSVDLWCVYGGEEYAQYDGGASIGEIVSNRQKSAEYGFFGNQSNDGVPRYGFRDLVPVAWRPAVEQCPAELIAKVLGIPVTFSEAISSKMDDFVVEFGSTDEEYEQAKTLAEKVGGEVEEVRK
jgi:hypothetical protein